MEIKDIKEKLSLAQVLAHYNLQPKNSMLKCFMHDDKTASLQVNLEKNFYKCHACGTSGDQIQIIEDYEKITKHEAIKKAVEMIGNKAEGKNNRLSASDFLGNMFQYFKKSVYNSQPAKEYLQKRGLDYTKIEVGYNSGQFHHGSRRDEQLIKQCLEYGLLIDKGLCYRTGETDAGGSPNTDENKQSVRQKAYSVFGKWCICFALKNCHGQTVSLYFRSILAPSSSAENQLPAVANRHFYLKNRSGIYPNYPKKETKKLILTEAIIDCATLLQISKIKENHSIIACFGTNGLNEEIQNAIKNLENLEEIIFCFDQDEPGKTAVLKYANLLISECPNLLITNVELPNKDVNETFLLHDESIFLELLDKRQNVEFLSSAEFKNTDNQQNKEKIHQPTTNYKLPTTNNHQPNPIDFLQQKNLLQKLNEIIEKSGIIGEENSRLLLFLIAISYLNKNPLHGIVQGSSGSGKTHIISKIIEMMPQEDVLRFTRITEGSLYNYGEFGLMKKIILIEDLDGLKEEALYAFRELISNQSLSSLTSIKDKKGNNKGTQKSVKGQFSSLSATTKGETYEDNMNRCFVLAINESEEQTEKIIHYQNRRVAGDINLEDEKNTILFIQKIVRNLKHYEVQNKYAIQIQLPQNVKNKRRLNEMFQATVKQITLLHQYQRRRASAGNYLITEIEDIEQAIEVLFESIVLKIDELDGSLRQFLEILKKGIENESFTRFDAMRITGLKKSQLQVYLNELVRFGYLRQSGHPNKGFTYKLGYNDDIQKVRQELKAHFTKQLEVLKQKENNS